MGALRELVTVSLLGAAALAQAPVAPQQPGDPAAGRSPVPRVVGVDQDGWPVFAPGGSTPPAPTPAAALRAPAVVDPPAVAEPPAAPAERRASEAATAVLDAAAALAPLWQRIGSPAAFAGLGGLRARCTLRVLDPERGAELGRREFEHLADLTAPRRDRLTLPDRRVVGRDGESVFAELHGLPMASLAAAARGELEVLGLLLRAPFCFADATRFEIVDRRSEGAVDAPLVAFELRPVGAERAAWEDARFTLVCAADSLRPSELIYRLAAQRPTRVRFSDWRVVRNGVAIPFRRELVDARGVTTSVLDLDAVEVAEQLLDLDFRSRR
ncbi:MAG: hypothetical protein IPM29_12410 [Planctomycetes bacterium]|nr:hypothetical protein [Planctomycetota bacterium]